MLPAPVAMSTSSRVRLREMLRATSVRLSQRWMLQQSLPRLQMQLTRAAQSTTAVTARRALRKLARLLTLPPHLPRL
eukprot:4038138-Alexandrium_andersonii.AAC.1